MRWVEKNHLSQLKNQPKSGLKRSQRKSSSVRFPTSEALTSVVFVQEATFQGFTLNESAPFRQEDVPEEVITDAAFSKYCQATT